MGLDRIPSEVFEICEPITVYRLAALRAAATEMVQLDKHHWLAVATGDGIIIEYGLYSWVTEDDNDALVKCVFRGSGAGGTLREMRHTYFSPDEQDPDCRGYVFYLPIDATIKALTHLKKYFDD